MFKLFSKRVLIYTALGFEDFSKVVGKLQCAGIKYKTKTKISNRNRPGQINMFDSKYTPYDIYVNKEDQHKAQEILNKR
jgi:hypothetical protein